MLDAVELPPRRMGFAITPPSTLLNRRRLIRLGGIGALGLGLPELLHASPSAGLSVRGKPKSCIFIVQYGGCSQPP